MQVEHWQLLTHLRGLKPVYDMALRVRNSEKALAVSSALTALQKLSSIDPSRKAVREALTASMTFWPSTCQWHSCAACSGCG